MTSVNITNYGSIYISEDSEVNPRRQEKERSRHISRTEDREETYQELLPQEESWTSRHKQFIGVSLAFVSGGLFTANNFLINQFHVSVPDLLLVRTLMQMLIYSSICYYRSLSPLPGPTRQRLLILLQGLVSSLTFITALAAVSYMPVPDALCIVFSCPVVTITLSAVVLKDRLGPGKIIAGVLLLSGVVLVCKPPFLFHSYSHKQWMTDDEYNLYYVGLILALISCFCGGVMNVVVSKCSSVASPVLVNMSAMLGLVMSLAFCLGDAESLIISSRITSVSWQQWATFTGLSVSGLLAFTTLTRSLQLVSPNLVSSLRCVELVLAFAVQSLITLQVPSIISCVGGGLIIIGVIILAFQTHFEKLQDIVKGLIKNIGRPSYENMETQRLL